MNTNTNRREVLKAGGGATVMALAIAAGLLRPEDVFAQAASWNKAAFDTRTLADAVKALGGAPATENKGVQFTSPTPDIAENGAVVPMTVQTSLPGAKKLLLLVEKNPSPLVAQFMLNPAVDTSFQTRAKMSASCDVYAVAVMDDGKTLFTKKEVKVTLGGCGG